MKKNLFIAFVTAVLLLALVMGCKHDPDPEPTPTPPAPLTKTVFVSAIAGVTSFVNNFDFTPTYNPQGGWDTDFPDGCITFELSIDGVDLPSGTTSIYATGRTDQIYYLVTQTFYYNNTHIGNRSIALEVDSNYFVDSYKSKTDFSVINAPVPALTLTLSKPR
jgi:hypothetical protein